MRGKEEEEDDWEEGLRRIEGGSDSDRGGVGDCLTDSRPSRASVASVGVIEPGSSTIETRFELDMMAEERAQDITRWVNDFGPRN